MEVKFTHVRQLPGKADEDRSPDDTEQQYGAFEWPTVKQATEWACQIPRSLVSVG